MEEETYRKLRRRLSFIGNHHSQQPSFTQFYSNNHSSDYLQLAIYNLNQLIKESEQEIFNEQKRIENEENIKLNKIENLQNDLNHIQINIDSLNNKIEKLTYGTYEMLFRQNEGALIRHNQLLKESIEHINHVLRKRTLINDLSFEQLKKELINQQEKLFLIRNQLDIDHNKLSTNISLLKECQQQRNQFEQTKLKKQIDMQNIQHIESKFYFIIYSIFSFVNLVDYVQRQLKLQKLQTSIEQQARVRNEIQQLEQYLEPKPRRDKSSEINETKEESDLTKHRLLEIVNEIDEETVEENERHLSKHNHTYNYPFNKLKDYRENNDCD